MKKQTFSIRLALIASSVICPGLLDRAMAQIAVPNATLVQVTGPAFAFPNEHLSLCFAKLDYPYTPEDPGGATEGSSFIARKKATVTLRIIDSTTGTEKVKKVVTVTPPALPSDPCVEFVVPAVTTTSTSVTTAAVITTSPVYIGVVSVSSEPVPPSAVSSSLQIFTPTLTGTPANFRVIPTAVTCPYNEYCAY